MRKKLFLFILASLSIFFLVPMASAQSTEEAQSASEVVEGQEKGAAPTALATKVPLQEASSQARQITALRNLIAVNDKRLKRLQRELQRHKREFTARSESFSKIDAELTQLEDQKEDGKEVSNAALSVLQEKWKRAREEFDFIISLTQAKESLAAIIEQKQSGLKAGMEQLLNPDVFRSRIKEALLGGNASHGEDDAQSPEAGPALTHPMLSLLSSVEGSEQDSSQVASASPNLRFDYRSADAAKEVFEKQVALAVEDASAKLLDSLLTLYNNDLAKMEEIRGLLETHQRKLAQWLEGTGEEQNDPNEPSLLLSPQEIARMKNQKESIRQSLQTIEQDEQVVRQTLAGLEDGRTRSGAALDKAEAELDEAIRALEFIQSPFAPHRIKRWLVQKLPGMLVTLVVLFAVWSLLKVIANRSMKVIEAGSRRGSRQERAERAATIHRVFRNVINVVVIVVGLILLLDQAGIDVTVLLGSAALVGVAVTFGAQSLIKDYFHGALVLVEDQFRVGNVVKIGDVVGTVEDITLRMVILRDLAGTLHFIPHGEVSRVSNLTHGWARVVFNIGVAYKEEVDRVMEILMELACELKKDKQFGKCILGEPEMLGVDEFADSAVNIKFLVKTKPLQQWVIKRELLRRIKNTFDEQGIEIPFPHRTVYMGDNPEPSEQAMGAS